jgi:hypothetical protein
MHDKHRVLYIFGDSRYNHSARRTCEEFEVVDYRLQCAAEFSINISRRRSVSRAMVLLVATRHGVQAWIAPGESNRKSILA